MKAGSLSIQEARKLVLLSQQIPPPKRTGRAIDATLSAIEHLGYVQIDTISVVQRAHHHTLWNRNPLYQGSHIDQLLAENRIFDYWWHAAAYLPMQDFRYSLTRKSAIASGAQKHWYEPDKPLMNFVLKRIADEGPLMTKDFENKGEKSGEWMSNSTKRALECLFMQGDLMVARRNNFHKVYDLTERVIPADTDTSIPKPEEYARFLIEKYLQANGLGLAGEMVYLLKDMKSFVSDALMEMTNSGELVQVDVKGNYYYAFPSFLDLLAKPLSRKKASILSPFDNLIIQRKRIRALFDFDYQLECYLSKTKRKFGYFSLPVLWDGNLLARMDCKADRKESVLHILTLMIEPGLRKREAFAKSLYKELVSFLRFNECNSLRIHRTTPTDFKQELELAMKNAKDYPH